LCVCPLLAEKYDGPRPSKPDLPYLIHADNLVPTESLEATQEGSKGDVTYTIPGANSTARTPLSSPAFLMIVEEIQADRMQLYKMQSKGGRREMLFARRKKVVARPIRLNVTRLEDNLYKLEVDDILENGEYTLTPQDSNKVFCFEIY
jgi:hypothetical protein